MKAGITQAQVDEFLAKPDEDFPDAEANAALGRIMTEDEALGNDVVFGKVKDKAKGEVLTPFTTLLGKYEKKLTKEQKIEYGKVGDDPAKKYEFLMDHFEGLGTKGGDANYTDLKKQFDELNEKLGTDYVTRADHDALNTRLAGEQRKNFRNELVGAARASKRLRDISQERRFTDNFVADAEELLNEGITTVGNTKVKGKYDPDTGRIMRLDSPDQPVMIGDKALTLDLLAEQVIGNDAYGWLKKSDTPPSGQIVVPPAAGKGTVLTAEQRKQIEQG